MGTLIVLCAAACAALAQDKPASIRGVIADPSGAPVANARLVLWDEGDTLKRAVSAADGSFQFAKVAPGKYHLTVRAGLDTDTYEADDIVVDAGRITSHVVKLDPAGTRKIAPESLLELPRCFGSGEIPSALAEWLKKNAEVPVRTVVKQTPDK